MCDSLLGVYIAIARGYVKSNIADATSAGDAVPVFTAFHRSRWSSWVIVAEVPMSIIGAPMRRALLGIGVGGGALLLGAIGLALWTARSMRRPIEAFDAAASAAEK